MILSKVYRLKEAAEVGKDMPLPKGKEIEIVMDVVYIDGNMVPPAMQSLFYNWLINNPNLFIDDTRNW